MAPGNPLTVSVDQMSGLTYKQYPRETPADNYYIMSQRLRYNEPRNAAS